MLFIRSNAEDIEAAKAKLRAKVAKILEQKETLNGPDTTTWEQYLAYTKDFFAPTSTVSPSGTTSTEEPKTEGQPMSNTQKLVKRDLENYDLRSIKKYCELFNDTRDSAYWNEIIKLTGYPRNEAPEAFEILRLEYNDGKLDVILNDNSESETESDQDSTNNVPGYRVQQLGPKESRPVSYKPPQPRRTTKLRTGAGGLSTSSAAGTFIKVSRPALVSRTAPEPEIEPKEFNWLNNTTGEAVSDFDTYLTWGDGDKPKTAYIAKPGKSTAKRAPEPADGDGLVKQPTDHPWDDESYGDFFDTLNRLNRLDGTIKSTADPDITQF